jgi:FAD binding domain
MRYEDKLELIINDVKEKAKTNSPVTFSKNSVSHFVPNAKDPRFKKAKINLKSLNNIIEVDIENKTCTAESGVTFYDLVKETTKFGLIPMTVPELKTITIGGAVSGCSVESMSYKYGGFHDSCIEYEIVTGDGKVIKCSPTEDEEIFHFMHNSFGTLGILTKLKFKLIPCKPFVKMEYVIKNNVKDYWKFLKESMDRDDYCFVDGIIYNKNQFVACLGTMVDKAPYLTSYQKENIFHKSVVDKKEDYMTLAEYFFRYDQDCHWLTNSMIIMENRLFRRYFGKFFLGSTNLIKWSKRLRHILKFKKRPEVVVDVFIPSYNFENFYNWYEKDFDFYPLWVVPYKFPEVYPWINEDLKNKMGEENMIIDFAIYGKKNNHKVIDYSQLLEEKVYDFNGVKTLISQNHYTEKRFWNIYNKKRYFEVKSKTDPNNMFSNIYSKFHQ